MMYALKVPALILAIVSTVWVAGWEREMAKRADGRLPPPEFVHIDRYGNIQMTAADGEVLVMER